MPEVAPSSGQTGVVAPPRPSLCPTPEPRPSVPPTPEARPRSPLPPGAPTPVFFCEEAQTPRSEASPLADGTTFGGIPAKQPAKGTIATAFVACVVERTWGIRGRWTRSSCRPLATLPTAGALLLLLGGRFDAALESAEVRARNRARAAG